MNEDKKKYGEKWIKYMIIALKLTENLSSVDARTVTLNNLQNMEKNNFLINMLLT